MANEYNILGRGRKPAKIVKFLRPSWNWTWLLGPLILFTVFVAYQPALRAGFIWDDDQHLTANQCIIGPLGFRYIWTSSAAVYYPLVLTSFWVQHALWGLNPTPYHLVDIAMHAACGILLWQVLQSLKVRGAWIGATLWALHPVQTESVAWITELKNTQSGCFYLLTILFFLKWRFRETLAKPQKKEFYYVLALLCAAAAILSKTSTVMLPVVLGLCWWWMAGHWNWRNIFRLVPFLAISGAASVWTIWEQKFHSGAFGPEWALTWSQRFAIAGMDIWFYLWKLLWPHPLIFLYPRWQINISHLDVYLPTLAAGIVGLVLWLKRKETLRPVFFAYAYFVVSLFPVLSFFNVYFFRYSFVGDHFQYLASMGPLALAGAGISAGLDTFKKRKLFLEPAVCGLLLTTLGILTWHQSKMYHDIETLWRTTIAANPRAFLAYNNLGSIYLQSGQVNTAIPCFQKALESDPSFAEAHSNLGEALMQTGRTDNGLLELEKAVAIAPRSAESQYNLGRALMQVEQLDGAADHFKAALDIKPDYFQADNNLGIVFLRMRQLDEASDYFQRALEIDPMYAEAHYNLGGVYELQGNLDQAVAQFQKALEIEPNYAHARFQLARALAAQGKLDDAMKVQRGAGDQRTLPAR